MVAAVLAGALIGLAVSVATTPAATTARSSFGTLVPGQVPTGLPFGLGFSSGTLGTVGTVSSSSFTMTTRAGQVLTVDEQSSTTYRTEAGPASASAVAKGDIVLVFGSRSGTVITATQVVVLPAGFSPGDFGPGPGAAS